MARTIGEGLTDGDGARLAVRLDRAARSLRERVEANVGAAQVAEDLAWAEAQAATARVR